MLLPWLLLLVINYSLLVDGQQLQTSQSNSPPGSPTNVQSSLSPYTIHTFRLRPGEDLKRGITNFVHKNGLQAVSIVTCVGSLRQVHLRLAAAHRNGTMSFYFRDREFFEIVSLVGTVESYLDDDKPAYGHLHLSLSMSNGTVIGGHVMKGCIVYTTAEVTLLENLQARHTRVYDRSTGFQELEVIERAPSKSLVTQPPTPPKAVMLYQKLTNSLTKGLKSIVETLEIVDQQALVDGLY